MPGLDAQHNDISRLQRPVTPGIWSFTTDVVGTIKLNRESGGRAVEINDPAVNWVLPSEFEPQQLALA